MTFDDSLAGYISYRSQVAVEYVREYFKDVSEHEDYREKLLDAFNRFYMDTHGNEKYRVSPQKKIVAHDPIIPNEIKNVPDVHEYEHKKLRGNNSVSQNPIKRIYDVPNDLFKKMEPECDCGRVPRKDDTEVSYKTKLIATNMDLPKDIDLYVDHGCGSGKITKELIALMHPKKTIGVDIYHHPLLSERGIDFVSPDANGKLSIPDSSAEVITCLLSMHHVGDFSAQKNTAKELIRILRPGGILILYEHDVSQKDKLLRLRLDIVHLSFVYYGTENEKEGNTDAYSPQFPLAMSDVQWIFDSVYHTRKEWRSIFSPLVPIQDFLKPNRQKMYFEVFSKKI